MRIVVVGAGLIGGERAEAIRLLQEKTDLLSLAYIVDADALTRDRMKSKYHTSVTHDLSEALDADPDWVFVCTPHDVAPGIAVQSLRRGASVLIEKPIGRTLAECDSIIASRDTLAKLNVGFNYRFYAGVERAILDARSGRLGKLISVNLTLGHGNAPGMDRSWKLDPSRAGGGCLIDPGIHLLDLALLLAKGNITVAAVRSWSGFWQTGIEEEAHVLLTDDVGTIFSVDVSLNRWRSVFRLEINGTEGYGIVEGRGRSYGPQTYRRGRRWGWEAGISQIESEEVCVDRDQGTDSFVRETALILGVHSGEESLWPCEYQEARRVMDLLERIRQNLE